MPPELLATIMNLGPVGAVAVLIVYLMRDRRSNNRHAHNPASPQDFMRLEGKLDHVVLLLDNMVVALREHNENSGILRQAQTEINIRLETLTDEVRRQS